MDSHYMYNLSKVTRAPSTKAISLEKWKWSDMSKMEYFHMNYLGEIMTLRARRIELESVGLLLLHNLSDPKLSQKAQFQWSPTSRPKKFNMTCKPSSQPKITRSWHGNQVDRIVFQPELYLDNESNYTIGN